MLADPLTQQSAFVQHQRSHGVGRLSVKSAGTQSRIENLLQEGCAKIRLPSSGEEGLQAIMINSSGGMTGGDRLEWSFGLNDNTSLTVTSQACERVYAASQDVAQSDVALTVGKKAKLAWLPQETILFNEGAFVRRINVDLAENAELLMVEPVIFGRQAMNETVLNGYFKDSWRVRRGGRLFHAEETLFEGDINEQLGSRAIASGQVAAATLLLIAEHAEGLVEPIRKIVGAAGGASYWNGKLLARIVAEDSYSLRKTLVPLIRLMNRNAPMPKVWAL